MIPVRILPRAELLLCDVWSREATAGSLVFSMHFAAAPR